MIILLFLENPVGSLEEHFRKSLGDEYSKWFHQGGGGVPPPVPSPGDMEIDVGTEKRRSTDSVREGGGVVPRIKGEKLGEEEVLKAFKDDQDMSGYTGITLTIHGPKWIKQWPINWCKSHTKIPLL